jgi:primase-polymerase (primpol)-like protein
VIFNQAERTVNQNDGERADFNSIPDELKKLDHWVLWKPVPRKDKEKPT